MSMISLQNVLNLVTSFVSPPKVKEMIKGNELLREDKVMWLVPAFEVS